MQYLLTEEEYVGLVSRKEVDRRTEAFEAVRVLLLSAAKFTCIHEKKDPPRRYGGYCDDCPVQKLKHGHGKLVCTKSWNHSK